MPVALRQQELIEQLRQVLLEQVPGPWQRVEFEARLMNAFGSYDCDRLLDSGERKPGPSPTPALDIADELKELMVTPAGGAWLSMRMTVHADGTADVSFNYDVDPTWSLEGGPGAYISELKMYPRAPEAVPGWWLDRIGGGLPYPTAGPPGRPGQLGTGWVPSPVEAFQAVLSPTGAEPERQLWTTTGGTIAAADRLAAAVTARGYATERSADESDPDDLPDGAEPVFQLVDLAEEGGAVALFDTGAVISMVLAETAHRDPARFVQAIRAAAEVLGGQHGWTMDPEQAGLLTTQPGT